MDSPRVRDSYVDNISFNIRIRYRPFIKVLNVSSKLLSYPNQSTEISTFILF